MLDRLKPFRKVALVSGVGAAGLLAYRMYAYGTETTWRSWWLPSCSFLPTSWFDYFATGRLKDESGEDRREEAQRAESERLARHFDMTIGAADDYHSEMLESIVAKLFQVDGLDEIVKSASESKSQDPKQNQIKTASFTRFIVAMWTVPVTFLLCRLMFCIFGRIVYLSMAAENIHKSRRQAYFEAEQCPPLFGMTYQRRLLRTFKSIIPDTISGIFFRLMSQTVSKHVDEIRSDAFTSLQSMNLLLSTINGDIENKIASENGEFWKSLLGDTELLRSLGLGTGDDGRTEQAAYIEDVLREARHIVAMRKWHVVVVDTVKAFVQKQTVFLNEAYSTVLDEIHHPQYDSDTISDNSYDEEDTDIIETGSSAFRRAPQEEDDTVIYDDDGESETSDRSAYDVSHASSVYYAASSRRTPQRLTPDRTRNVAEGSLEPLDCDEAEGHVKFETVSAMLTEEKGPCWDAQNDSEMDTGEHHSFDHSLSPAPVVRNRPMKLASPAPLPDGIPFFRWATKLGRQGKFLLKEDPTSTPELASLAMVHDFCVYVFAPDSVTSLPKCQLKSAPDLHERC